MGAVLGGALNQTPDAGQIHRFGSPMASLQATTALMGIGLAVLILYLIRRDHLYLMHGLFWVVVAGAAALLGAWPGLIDRLAKLLGISYPPALLLLLASMVLLVKSLHTDMVNTRIERDVRRLNQRLALLQADNESLRARVMGDGTQP
ncbi:DUF2304 domain-containing protein [Acidovorax sp. SUPP2539]|nr:DUF2304 domain-containing protein [Acidovorax sp. SUPP2539]